MEDAYAGIDVAFAKVKRLPVVVCRKRGGVLEPLDLRRARAKPPRGEGNARILESGVVDAFASSTVAYLESIETEFGVRIRRVAVDAPSDPRPAGTSRRRAELALDRKGISCIGTPDEAQLASVVARASEHLARGGSQANLPGANQLWMLVGFALFRALRSRWECLEVFPQAIVCAIGAAVVHKSTAAGLSAQLIAAAHYTGWPGTTGVSSLETVGYGSRHDRLDAYMSAWVASLDPAAREPLGEPPTDVIWIPCLEWGA
jgi:hypothetical protein